jgi:hypothetical protein
MRKRNLSPDSACKNGLCYRVSADINVFSGSMTICRLVYFYIPIFQMREFFLRVLVSGVRFL